MRLLQKYRPRGVMHCYSGSAEMVREVLALGLYIGFTGVVTFPNARKVLEAAAAVPVDRLLAETDCPYMAPVPFRGKRCDSSMLPHTIEALAAIHGVEPQKLADITFQNACDIFEIDANCH
jgi:TatD DNase family protein